MGTVTKAKELEDRIYDSILFIGPPGSGKTTASAMLGGSTAKLAIDLDDKYVNTIRSLRPEFRAKALESIDVWRPTHKLLSGDARIGITRQERYDQKKNIIPGTQGYIPSNPQGFVELVDYINSLQQLNPFPYKYVIVDHLTAISEHLVYLILKHHQVGVFTQPLWGVYKQNMLELTKGILSLPCHRVLIVHETTREDENTEQVKVRPSIMGSYRDEIAKEFTEVYTFSGRRANGDYMIRTVANSMYLGRTTKGLPAECKVEDMVAVYGS